MLWLQIRFILSPKIIISKMEKYSEDLSLVGPETVDW